MPEGGVEFANPWLPLPLLRWRHLDLGLARIEPPGSAQQEIRAVGKDLETQDIDRDVAVIEVADDPGGARVDRGGDNDDLMRGVQCVLIQRLAEAGLKVGAQVAVRLEAGVDRGDFLGLKVA